MPSLASSSQSSSYSSRGILAAVAVVLVILGFVFLPELLQVDRSSPPEPLTENQPVLAQPDPRDKPSIVREPTNVKTVSLNVEQERTAQNGNFDTLSDRQPTRFEVIENATWEVLTSKAATRALQNAVRAIDKLDNVLKQNVRGVRTRDLLMSYKENILKLERMGEESFDTPQDALKTLYRNELAITRMMVKEKVDRASRIFWTRVNLGEGLQVGSSMKVRDKIVGPFSPDPMLVKVQIYQKTTYGRYEPQETVTIVAEGTMRGEDIESAELIPIEPITAAIDVPVRRWPDLLGLRKFHFTASQPPVNMSFILKVKDIQGNYYQKKYNFYPNVRRFRWLGRKENGAFDVPYQKGDYRIDAYFSQGAVRARSASSHSGSQSSGAFVGGGGMGQF